MRMFCASVLFFEALVVALAIPVALSLTDASAALVGWGFGGLAIGCLVCAGLLRHGWAVWVGWALQVGVLATALVVPMMLILGVIFVALWFLAIRFGRRVDAIKAARTPA